MLGTERQEEILKYIKANKTASVKKLTEIFYASEATIRRDLNELEKTGIVKRIFGGVTLVFGSDTQIPLFVREKEDNTGKNLIAKNATELIKNGDVIYLDGSSTAQYVAKNLYKFKDIIVITNGLKIAEILGEMHIKVYLTGGLLIDDSYVFAGSDSERFVENYNADICFLSCKGLDLDGTLSDTSKIETELRKKILDNSRTKVMLITQNKIGKKYIHKLCNSNEIDYIFSDGEIPDTVKTKKSI